MHVPIIPLGTLTHSSPYGITSGNSAGQAVWRNPFNGAAGFSLPSIKDTIELWMARRQQRQQLNELAISDDHLLDDIGVSRDAALREAEKWFWQR